MNTRRKPNERPKWLNPDNTYDLLHPITWTQGESPQVTSRLNLRRLTAADMLILDEALPYTEKLLRIIEGMTGQLRAVTIRLDSVDMDRIDDIFGYFREPGQATGATS